MTNEDWKEFVDIVRNNSFEDNVDVLKELEKNNTIKTGEFFGIRYQKHVSVGLQRFLIERVLYPIGNKQEISCKCGSHNGYVVEFEDHNTVYQHTVCMLCDTVQEFTTFEKNKNQEEEECFAPTSGTWLSRLAQRLLPQAV